MAATKKLTQPVKASTSEDAARAIADLLRKKHGKETAIVLSDGGSLAEVTEVIPTGLQVIDRYVLGVGGLPVGRISELYGPEGVGKSSFMLRCMAAAQRGGGLAVLAENENSLQPDWAQDVHGVDPSKVLLIETDTLEQTTQRLVDAISVLPDLPGPSFFAWDTLAATPTRREIEEGIDGKDKVGEVAKLMSKAMRVLTRLVAKRRVHLMLVNQIRDNIGVMFGDKTTTPGGHAVKFHASVRLSLMGGKKVTDKDSLRETDEDEDELENKLVEHTGKDVTLVCTKNKLCIPWRKARLRLDYKQGWLDEWSLIYHAKERGILGPRMNGHGAYVEALEALGWQIDTEPDQREVPL